MIILERFEGDNVVVEFDGVSFSIPRSFMPVEANEGDVLELIINKKKSDERRRNIHGSLYKLFEE
jgi:hypothetical protein